MHYYKRNLGDYAKKAGRLTMLQHGAYNLLLDACYDRERFPTRDEAIDWAWAASAAEIEAVEFVLRKFFTLTDGVYVQERIQQELDEFAAKSAKNKQIAHDRETKRARNVDEASPVVDESSPNQEPVTNNQERAKKEQGARATRLPQDWQPSPDELAWARNARPDVDPAAEAAKFRDYWHAKGGKDATKTDWSATWRNWIRNSHAPPRRGTPTAAPSKQMQALANILGVTHENNPAAGVVLDIDPSGFGADLRQLPSGFPGG